MKDPMSPTEDVIYTTPDSYIAALETHGATVGDIPRMLSTLRQQSARIRELEAVESAARAFHERWQTSDFEDDTKPARQALFAALAKVPGSFR